ncbi:MAG: hypothetical protein WCF12_15155, partial [Propionicimonas sp.]
MFSSEANARRHRRPTDALLLVLSAVLILISTAYAPGPSSIDEPILALLSDLSGVLGWLWEMSYALLLVWVVLLLVAPVVRTGQGRLRLLLDYCLALITSLLFSVGVSWAGGTGLEDSVLALVSADPPPVFAAVRLAVATAVIVTAAPHVTRPFRLAGRVVVALGALATLALQLSHLAGVVAGLAVGFASAAVVHLVLGSPGGQLTADQVGEALLDLGVGTRSREIVPARAAGEQLVRALTTEGEALEVKVFGREAWDARYVGSLWTALTRRGETPRLAVSRLERVEHEAVVSLLAERAGVPVLPVMTTGEGVQGEALLVTLAPARALDQGPGALDQDVWLRGAWSALTALQDAGIAHRRITGAHVVERVDATIALADFAHAQLAASTTDLMIDRVHLLVTLSLAFGHEQAVASAIEALGPEGLAEALPYLQDPVLSPPLRRALGTEWDIQELRDVAVQRTGVDPGPLAELRRVTAGSVAKLVLTVVVASSLIGLLAGVDFTEVVAELSTADYALLLLGLVLAPLAQPFFAVSTLAASLQRLPHLPVLMLQYAIQFIALVLPATAARVALQIRFFERLGVPYGAATLMGMIDGVGGFVVQVLLLILISASSLPGVTTTVTTASDSGGEESADPSLLALAVLVALAWAAFTLAVPRRRAQVRRAIPRYRA